MQQCQELETARNLSDALQSIPSSACVKRSAPARDAIVMTGEGGGGNRRPRHRLATANKITRDENVENNKKGQCWLYIYKIPTGGRRTDERTTV